MVKGLIRSYYLPGALLDAFGKAAAKGGYVRERAVAAAILHFLSSSASERAKLFERLDRFQNGNRK